MDPLKIEELLGKVRAATGADRRLDADIFRVVLGSIPELSGHVAGVLAGGGHNYPEYTRSIDAALALVEKVQPGTAMDSCSYWPVLAGGEEQDNRHANVSLLRTKDGWGVSDSRVKGAGSTLPLAILAALLTALATP